MKRTLYNFCFAAGCHGLCRIGFDSKRRIDGSKRELQNVLHIAFKVPEVCLRRRRRDQIG